MKKRLIFQAGFHKTGNKSIQLLFRKNAEILRPYCHCVFKWDIEDLNAGAHAFGSLPTPYRRNQLRKGIRAACDRFATLPDETICIFAEDLCGPMPGLNDVSDYGHAQIIAKDLVRISKQQLGDDLDVSFLYTTRDQDPWMNSLYRHHVKDGQMQMDYTEFACEYPNASALDAIVRNVSQKVAPDKTHMQRLEDVAGLQFGPAQILLDILGVPRDVLEKLTPVGLLHKGLSKDMTAQFLTLNRTIDDLDQLKEMKRKILGHV